METGRGLALLGSQGDRHLSSWLRAAHGSLSGAAGHEAGLLLVPPV